MYRQELEPECRLVELFKGSFPSRSLAGVSIFRNAARSRSPLPPGEILDVLALCRRLPYKRCSRHEKSNFQMCGAGGVHYLPDLGDLCVW